MDKRDVRGMTNDQLGALIAGNADPKARVAAIRELAGRRDPASLPVLRRTIEQDAVADLRKEALLALERGNGIADSSQPILRAMGDADPEVRLHALRIAGKHRISGAGARICQLLDDPDRRVQAAAWNEIEDLKSPDAADCALERFQKAPDAATKLRAIRILRRAESKKVAPALAASLAGADEKVQREILVALRELRDASVIPQLEQVRQSTADRRLKKMIAETVGYLKRHAK